jgi:hypothetical protein
MVNPFIIAYIRFEHSGQFQGDSKFLGRTLFEENSSERYRMRY